MRMKVGHLGGWWRRSSEIDAEYDLLFHILALHARPLGSSALYEFRSLGGWWQAECVSVS